MLSSYSNSQTKRNETLREEKKTWGAENGRLKAELEDAKSSIATLTERLAEAERKAFELESERAHETTTVQS